jgi:hypothetical protein
MNNTGIEITARIAATHRADVAREVATARVARRTRRPQEPTVTEAPSGRWSGWSRWVPAPRPAH